MQSAPATADDDDPPDVKVPSPESSPVKKIDSEGLKQLGVRLDSLFMQYVADRRIAELRWLRNQRQYLGLYDPEVEKELSPNRSKAYPKLTRVKCISVLSRLMNLMFPGNERNWELKAAPWPEMTEDDVMQAVQQAQAKDQQAGVQVQMDSDYIFNAVTQYMSGRAEKLSCLIDDQLQELGGDQTYDYVALNRKVIQSGILYGMGVLCGPYARKCETVTWGTGEEGAPTFRKVDFYKPTFDFVPVWDFYPDMSAKTFASMDGYFRRHVMSRAQLRSLADREDFLGDQIKSYLQNTPQGNYKPQPYEWELRTMGVKVNVNEMKAETMKYEVLAWHGKTSGEYLRTAGVEVDDDKVADDIDAEIWMIGGVVIKATLNPWREMGVDVNTAHIFLFDEDDTSPIGFGLPNAIRDSQLAVSAAARMLLDNASVVCGPQLELNTNLLMTNQDLTSTSSYKIWYRDDDMPTSQYPAVRNVQIDAHLDPLMKIIALFREFADSESFVGPATGGDMSQAPSEPMRTAAGASMLRGDAALPFKDIVRSYDRFTQSQIISMVYFNRKLNPDLAPDGDYDVIARGATSLIAKEIRGAQADQLAQTLTPQEMLHIDERKLVEARLKARDMDNILVPPEEAQRRQAQQSQQAQEQQQMVQEEHEANVRNLLSTAYKNIAQGQKNTANADATTTNAAMDLLEKGLTHALALSQAGSGDASQQPAQGAGGGGSPPVSGLLSPPA